MDPTVKLPPDALNHNELARVMLKASSRLGGHVVVSIEGSWGRGKTDLLARMADAVRGDGDDRFDVAGDPLWLNPWQHARPDLLSPLACQLLDRNTAPGKPATKAVKTLCRGIIRAGLQLGTRVASFVAPGGQLIGATGNATDSILQTAFESIDQHESASARPDIDPVARLGEHFRDLATQALEHSDAGSRLMICVDDLDRCLPTQQVAMLEAIHFLASANAPVTIFVALDSTLADQALAAHYGTSRFETNRYLDKLFHLRVPLRALSADDVQHLAEGHIERFGEEGKAALERILPGGWGAGVLAEMAPAGLPVPELRSPRIVRRVFDRLHLLTASGDVSELLGLTDRRRLILLFAWLAIAERWPEVRTALQNSLQEWDSAWACVCCHFRGQQYSGMPARMKPLPPRESAPEFQEFIDQVAGSLEGLKAESADVSGAFARIDRALRTNGL